MKTGSNLQRRSFLRLGALGLSLPQLLQLRANSRPAEATTGFGRAKSCIVLFCWGGISHLETWDPKPNAPSEVRGLFQPIRTSVPGIHVGEHIPKIASIMHHLTVVRSAFHNAPSHRSGAYWNLTGHEPPNLGGNWPVTRKDWPSLNSMVAAALADMEDPRSRNGAMPASVAMPYRMEDGGVANGQDAGFLGLPYDPAILRPKKTGAMYNGKSPSSTHLNLDLPPGMDATRRDQRTALLEQFDKVPSIAEMAQLSQARTDAIDMLMSPGIAKAFDVELEPAKVREAYGDHICGKSALLARRLTGAGVPIATVYCAAGDLNGSKGAHFDTHADNFNRLKRDMLPPLDQASKALIEDLEASGRLDDTLVVWLTEFGRTPKINKAAGRDHFPNCYSVAFAGAGVSGGRVYGASNAIGHDPAEDACGPADLHATIFHALGINPEHRIHDALGRPLAICDGRPLPIFA